jgi:hypothetical protein
MLNKGSFPDSGNSSLKVGSLLAVSICQACAPLAFAVVRRQNYRNILICQVSRRTFKRCGYCFGNSFAGTIVFFLLDTISSGGTL